MLCFGGRNENDFLFYTIVFISRSSEKGKDVSVTAIGQYFLKGVFKVTTSRYWIS
jgi:hypothetical protein